MNSFSLGVAGFVFCACVCGAGYAIYKDIQKESYRTAVKDCNLLEAARGSDLCYHLYGKFQDRFGE